MKQFVNKLSLNANVRINPLAPGLHGVLPAGFTPLRVSRSRYFCTSDAVSFQVSKFCAQGRHDRTQPARAAARHGWRCARSEAGG